jgi:hypothetical protein
MSRGPFLFREREIARAVRGVRATGLPIHGIEVDSTTGKITVLTGNGSKSDAAAQPDECAVEEARQLVL